jgi:ABC-type dipeptide/oligopeptide/nickel transport system permease component
MLEYIIARIARSIPTVLLLSIAVFSMMHLLPGDPATAMLSEQEAASKEAVERLREQLGLNDPLHIQYWRFVSRAVRGDFGHSIVLSRRPVVPMVLEVFPNTIQLTLTAVLFSVVIGVPLGVIAAVKQNSVVDNLAMAFSFVGVCMPVFWAGLLLIIFFCVKLRWFSVINQEGWKALILPAVSLGWGAAGVIARLTRGSLLEVLQQDYMTTARAKGLRELRVVIYHGLRNSLIPVVTVVGLQFGSLLGGAVVTETVFGRRGIGRIAVDAVLAKDFPVVQGTVFVAAISYISVNLMVDILYAWLDPRIRYD